MRGLAGEKLPEELWNWPKRKTSAWLVRCVRKAELRARGPGRVHGSCVSQESLGREGYSTGSDNPRGRVALMPQGGIRLRRAIAV